MTARELADTISLYQGDIHWTDDKGQCVAGYTRTADDIRNDIAAAILRYGEDVLERCAKYIDCEFEENVDCDELLTRIATAIRNLPLE